MSNEPNHCASCCEDTDGDLHINPEHDEDHDAVTIYIETCEAIHPDDSIFA